MKKQFLNILGPIDGIISTVWQMYWDKLQDGGPVLIHVITQKGKGYEYAEKDPEFFYGYLPLQWKPEGPRIAFGTFQEHSVIN